MKIEGWKKYDFHLKYRPLCLKELISACNSCAREELVANDKRCPICEEGDILPDDLIPDRSVRMQVAGFNIQQVGFVVVRN